MPRDPHISVRLPRDIRTRLEKAAPPADGQRSAFVVQAIEQRLKRWEAEQRKGAQ